MPAVLGVGIGFVRIAFGRREPVGRVTVFASAVVTGVGFVLVKTSPAAAAVASRLWSVVVGPSQIRADVTDLVTLPGLGLAVWVGLGAVVEARTRRRRAGTLVALVLLPTATLAIAATSAPQYPDAVTVQVLDGRFVVGEANAYHDSRAPDQWRISYDGGFVWHYLDSDERESVDEASVPRRGCVAEAPTHCYRVVPGHLRVEESLDGGGTWRVSWEITDEKRRPLAHRYDGLRDVDEYLSSRSLAVASVPGGHAVVVANGRDGYAVRDTAGQWFRIGFGSQVFDDGSLYTQSPPPLDRSIKDAAPEIAGGVLVGLLAVAVAGCVALWREERRWPTVLATPLWATGALLALLGAVGVQGADSEWWPFGPILSPVGIVVGAFLAVVAACFAVTTGAMVGALRPGKVLALSLIGLASAAAPIAVYLAWAGGHLGYRMAGLATLHAAVVGLTSAVLVALRASRPGVGFGGSVRRVFRGW
jgi:hypothetical protein